MGKGKKDKEEYSPLMLVKLRSFLAAIEESGENLGQLLMVL
jgi:hypothetical protein